MVTVMEQAPQGEIFSARSWLFAPGDSERKMEKATASAADIVIFDLEDAVAEEEKPKARSMVSAFLKAQPADRSRLWVRINPLRGPSAPNTLTDLAAVVPGRPGGIMLPKSRGRADVEILDNCLSALEVSAGIEQGSTKVIVLVTETADGMFTTGSYAGAPRVVAMTWGAEDLADAVGASENRNPDGSYAFTYELARSLCLLGAAAAGVAAIETIHGDFRDDAGLRRRASLVRRAGYRGMLAIHPAQVDVINEAFTPCAEELAAAQEIVDLFAANPGAGTIGHKGAMLDRPHLARAQALLRLVARR
jgi:citrate lyase subunit beta/citryl-CoA lyase